MKINFSDLPKSLILSFRYGGNLAYADFMSWLVLINLLAAGMAAFEIYAWSNSYPIIGVVIALCFWVVDQFFISADNTKFSIKDYFIRGFFVLIPLGITIPILTQSLDKDQLVNLVSNHNEKEFGRLNNFLDSAFEREKSQKEQQLRGLELKISEYQKTLENRKSSYVDISTTINQAIPSPKSKKKGKRKLTSNKFQTTTKALGIQLDPKTGQPITKDDCDGKSCSEVATLLEQAKKDKTTLEELIQQQYSTEMKLKNHVIRTVNIASDVKAVIANGYCNNEFKCDFYSYDNESLESFSEKISEERQKISFLMFMLPKAQLISDGVIAVLFASFIYVKTRTPKSALDYYNENFQQGYLLYTKGGFNQILDDPEEKPNGNYEMDGIRFIEWFQGYINNKDIYDAYDRYAKGFYDEVIDKDECSNAPSRMKFKRFRDWYSTYNYDLHQKYKRYISGLFDDIIEEKDRYSGSSKMDIARFKDWHNEYNEILHNSFKQYIAGSFDDLILDKKEKHDGISKMDFSRFKDWHTHDYPILKNNTERVNKIRELRAEIDSLESQLDEKQSERNAIIKALTPEQESIKNLELELAELSSDIKNLEDISTNNRKSIEALSGQSF